MRIAVDVSVRDAFRISQRPSSRRRREHLHAFISRLIHAARGIGPMAAAPRALVAL